MGAEVRIPPLDSPQRSAGNHVAQGGNGCAQAVADGFSRGLRSADKPQTDATVAFIGHQFAAWRADSAATRQLGRGSNGFDLLV